MTTGATMSDHVNFGDYLLAAGNGEDIAVVGTDRRYSYAELRAAASRLVAELAALDLPAGSRVAVLAPNSFFWVAAYLATMQAGHVVVPVSEKLLPEDVRRNLDLVGCAAVLLDRRLWRRFDPALGGGVQVLTDELLGDEIRTDGAPVPDRQPSRSAAAPGDPDADAALMFTSGTTSRPRAVRVTHRNLRANTESIIDYLGLRADDRVLVILPFFYCYGASLLHTHLRVGGRVVIAGSFAFPEAVLDQLEREECTVLAGVPSSFQLLLRASSFATRELPSLRVVQQAGGKLLPVLVEELRAARNPAQLFLMYGQTEATARLSYLPPQLLPDKPGSIGRGIPGVELRVLDEDGHPVGPGECGEIYATGENISPGYYADPAGSAAKFTPDGLRTGDVATVDEDGDIFVVDRRDDFIKAWGYRVSSQEVEACAMRIDRVVSAAAIGVPDAEAGEAVTLFVVARPGTTVTPEEVLTHCRVHLAKHMIPGSVSVLDALPLNAHGKIAKPTLRELATRTGNAG